MADTKITDLAAASSVTTDDLILMIDNPGGVPTGKKVTFDNLQKSITTVGGASGVATLGDVSVPIDKYFYIGDSTTNGSWRFYISSGDLTFEKREAGTWNLKGTVTA